VSNQTLGHQVKNDLFLSAQKQAKTAPKTNKQANKQNKPVPKNKTKKWLKFLGYGHMIAIMVCLLGASSYLPSFFVLKKF
jgi:hypothetical protein